jgi:hypothetical protein
MVVVSAHCRAGYAAERGAGSGGPALGGRCEGEGTAVEDLSAALPGDQGVERAEGPSFAGEDQDAGRGSFAATVHGWQVHVLAEVVQAWESAPDSQSARRPRATPMQAAMVVAVLPGESGSTRPG